MEYSDKLYTDSHSSDAKLFSTTSRIVAVSKSITVVDDAGNPLPGAHVYGSSGNGTTTDFDGKANVTAEGSVTISYMGFETQTFPFPDLPAVVQMRTADNSLDEVLIIAPKKTYFWTVFSLTTAALIAAATRKKKPQAPAPKEVTL